MYCVDCDGTDKQSKSIVGTDVSELYENFSTVMFTYDISFLNS